MRAMILAAGFGTRLRPLSDLLPKPAMPVRGLPVIAYNLALLAKHGVTEVMINTHYLPEAVVEAAERHCPPGVTLHFSHEPDILDTGGGLRKVADFLRGSDTSLLLAGDMLLDVDLTRFVEKHRAAEAAITFGLLDDPRRSTFGSIGIDGDHGLGRVRRIANRLDLGDENRAGIYVSVTALSADILGTLPDLEKFSHLEGWVKPMLLEGRDDIFGELFTKQDCFWEPVGTCEEYLNANFIEHNYSYLEVDHVMRNEGVQLNTHSVLGRGVEIRTGDCLRRVVVWDGEHLPENFHAENGIFAGGDFYACYLSDLEET
jgi:mannose-1-phosphate guanylyltransferase